jgi:phage tail P2-like protein
MGALVSNQETLLPLNATPQEIALDLATSRISDVPVPLRDLWNPDTCPSSLLPWLAWAFSVDSWKSYWPDNVKRAIVKNAVITAKKKGTRKAVADTVANFGAALSMREWWEQTPPGTPHTFDLTLTVSALAGADNNTAFQDDILNEVNRVKPVRSHYNLTVGTSASGSLYWQGGAQPVNYTRLNFTEV